MAFWSPNAYTCPICGKAGGEMFVKFHLLSHLLKAKFILPVGCEKPIPWNIWGVGEEIVGVRYLFTKSILDGRLHVYVANAGMNQKLEKEVFWQLHNVTDDGPTSMTLGHTVGGRSVCGRWAFFTLV